MDKHSMPQMRNTNGFFIQSAIAFAVSLAAMVFAILYIPADGWVRAFLGLGTLFLVTSSFSLAKCVRDAQESSAVTARVDQARVDRILTEHDPFQH